MFKFVVLKDPKCSYKDCVWDIARTCNSSNAQIFVPFSYSKGNKVWHLIFDIFDSKLPIIEDTLVSLNVPDFKDTFCEKAINRRNPADLKGEKDHLRRNFKTKIIIEWCWPHIYRASDRHKHKIFCAQTVKAGSTM